MNKRHCDDSSLTPGGSRIPLTRSCSSPAVSHGKCDDSDFQNRTFSSL